MSRRSIGVAVLMALAAAGAAATWRSWPDRSELRQAAPRGPGAAAGRQTPAVPLTAHTHAPGPELSTQEQIAQAFRAMDELERRTDATAFDIETIGRRLGGDPGAVAKWMARTIRYEHYSGLLRGAWGTLIAGAGNVCDQATLVRALLAAGGTGAQLRVASAAPAIDAALVGRALRDRLGPEPPGWPGGAVRAQVERQLATLTAVSRSVATAIATGPRGGPVSSAYCWVETAAGEAIEPVLGVPKLAPDAGSLVADIPAELRHRVTIEVTLRSRTGSEVLLSHTINTDEYRLDAIALALVPATPNLLNRLQAGEEAGRVLAEVDTFQPLLTVGAARIDGRLFNLAGEIVNPASDNMGAGALGSALGDLLSRGGNSRPRRSSIEVNPHVRVTLDYRTAVPGLADAVSSRTLVDFSRAASLDRSRVPLAIIQRRQTIISTFAAPGSYVQMRAIAGLRANRPVIEEVARARATGGSIEPRDIPTWPLPLVAFAQAQDAAAQALIRTQGGALFRATPGIVDLTSRFAVDGRRVSEITGIDIVRTGFEALPRNAAGRLLRAKLGVYSSILEAEVLGRGAPVSGAALDAAARREAVGLRAVTSAEVGDTALRITPEQREGLAADAADGNLLVAYASPVDIAGRKAYGWWRIERDSGEVLAVLDGGSGGAQTASELTFTKTVAIGAVSGALGSYLICWLQEGIHPSYCIFAGVCGAAIGGVFGALAYGVIGIFGAATTVMSSAPVLGGGTVATTVPPISAGAQGAGTIIGSTILDNIINPCQGRPPLDNWNDNDLDGRPNDEDPNDDCPRCDDDNPPPNDRNDDEDPDDDNDGVADTEDPLPSNQFEQSDLDRDGWGDNHEDMYNEDTDGDGVRNSEDDYPHDPAAQHDRDGDGVEDKVDRDPRDPARTVDRDGDDIDDSVDVDPTREGPWMTPDDEVGDESPQITWEKPTGPRDPESLR